MGVLSLIEAGGPRSCSVAIAGAGLAGLELARQLETLGVPDVLVIEAGPAEELRHINSCLDPATAARTWLDPGFDQRFHRPWTSLSAPHYTGCSGLRRLLGGRSLYWSGVILPVESWALASWPEQVSADLIGSWQAGSPLYDRVIEQICEWRGPDAAHATGTLSADEDQGITVGGIRAELTPTASRRSSADPDRWYAYSPLDVWRDPESGSVTKVPSGCRIIAQTEVLHLLHRNGRCRGLLVKDAVSGDVRSIDARLTVLAAGTLECSRLAVQLLAELGVLKAPRLGGLVDHIVQGVFARFRGAQAEKLLETIAPANYCCPCAVRANLYVEVVRLPGDEALLDVRVSGEQKAAAGSYVECRPQLGYPWEYQVMTGIGDADREVIDAQQEVLQEVWNDIAKAVGSSTTVLQFEDFAHPSRTNAFILPEYIGAVDPGAAVTWASYLGTEDHEGGTLPLGDVLTTGHEFAEVNGLFAVGPATFPRAGAANPVLTVLALARRLAAELAARA